MYDQYNATLKLPFGFEKLIDSWAEVAYKSSSARLEENTKSTDGNLSMHSTRDIGRQLKRRMDGCIRK